MRSAMVVMVALTAALLLGAWARGGAALVLEGLRSGARGAVQLMPLLLVIFLLTGLVEVLMPRELVARWLSDASGLRGYLLALLAGALTPGGGPVGLPLAAMLARQGAGPGILVTYLTSMALLSFIRLPVEMGLIGPRLALLRLGASALLPLLAGGIARLLVRWVGV